MKSKVFCIGFHKTGTSSMRDALSILGYRVQGGIKRHNPYTENTLAIAYDLVKQYDAFQDNPWPIIYKEIDKKFPGSKFILMLRDPELWINSQVRHFAYRETPMRKWIYGVGCPKGNEAVYIKRFKDHSEEVVNYFRNRPQDLLILDLEKGDGWKKLCPFLGKNIRGDSFPHANQHGSW